MKSVAFFFLTSIINSLTFLEIESHHELDRKLCYRLDHKCRYGTISIPIEWAWCITDRQKPSNDFPACRGSECLILAISYTCLREIVPIVSEPGLLAPFRVPFFFPGGASAAMRSKCEACGVRTSNVNDRSPFIHIRHGIGVPGMMWAVRALNSWPDVSKRWLAKINTPYFIMFIWIH